MFINDLSNIRNLQCVVLQELRNHGIKYRLKKSNGKTVQRTAVIFGADISSVPLETVTCCGSKLNVPLIVYDACNMLKCHVHVEGLFRKAGSQTRQKEIKKILDTGGRIDKSCHAVDIAGILKLYLRALPSPIIGNDMQELLLRCWLLSDSLRLGAIQNALLLLPVPYLYILHYIMEFFRFVSSKSDVNRMDANNLAIVLAPSVMPLPSSYPPQRMEQHVRLVKFFIENANLIGRVPEATVSHLDEDTDKEEEQRQKKKRRSGSLTRMLNGLRKMVGASSSSNKSSTPDLLATPVLNKGMNKRKQDTQQGLSAKKRKEILDNLPQRPLICTPMRKIGEKEHKKLRLSIGRKSKEKQFNYNTLKEMPQDVANKNQKSLDNLSNFDIKSDYSNDLNIDLSDNKESDYVRIPKSEYEAIKNRVSAIENRISQEFNVITAIDHANVNEPVKQVQTAYEKTLEEAAILASPGSEQLAKRLSRELKIRRSDEHKIIRSPSARKIGTIRRRSRENVTKLTRTQTWNVSSQSSVQTIGPNSGNPFYPHVSLRRGRPNTVNTGLSHPSPAIMNSNSNTESSLCRRRLSVHGFNTNQSSNTPIDESSLTRNHFKRASSFHGNVSMANPSPKEINERVGNVSGDPVWKSANSFISSVETIENPITGRASVAKIRSQNAGMVMAKARLFDGMTDSDTSIENKVVSTKPARHTGFARKPRKCAASEIINKYVSNSSMDTDSSSSALENKHLRKACKSPGYVSKRSRSKHARSPVTVAKMKENLNLSSQLKEVIYDICTPMSDKLNFPLNQESNTPNQKVKVNGVYKTPRTTPVIKRPISVKTNKTFKVTQSSLQEGRKVNTPLRANHSTPRRQSPRLLSMKARQIVQN